MASFLIISWWIPR